MAISDNNYRDNNTYTSPESEYVSPMREIHPGRDIGFTDSNQSLYEAGLLSESVTSDMPGWKQTTQFKPKYSTEEIEEKRKKSKRVISKVFSNLSRFGLQYSDMILKNMRAVPADKDLLPKDERMSMSQAYQNLASSWKNPDNRYKNFFEKDFAFKRDALRNLAVQPELEDIIDEMSNESIVYDADNVYFAEPYIDLKDISHLKDNIQQRLQKSMERAFRKFYKMLDWKTNAWDDFKRFLIEGIMAWEIVYDSMEHPSKIIGMVPLDPATLTRSLENNKWYWYQFKGNQNQERRLLDAQVIYIQYQETNSVTRLSYLERLIRPFNIYRIIEQAQIIWTVTNAQFKTKFTIPVKGMNKANGSQTLAAAMNRYKEDIKFIADSGELQVNGQVNMPFNKEYWMPENEAGTPQIDVIGGEGPELNDNNQLRFFKNQLYKISKVPLSRFDQENEVGWFGTDATSYARTEIDFARFVNRLRNTFAQVMLKPLMIQVCLDIPELMTMREVVDAIQLQFKSYNVFEELLEQELMTKRIEFIEAMKNSLVTTDANGAEHKFFSSEFLVKKYLHMSDADLRLNEELREKEEKEFNEKYGAAAQGGDGMGGGYGMDDMGLSGSMGGYGMGGETGGDMGAGTEAGAGDGTAGTEAGAGMQTAGKTPETDNLLIESDQSVPRPSFDDLEMLFESRNRRKHPLVSRSDKKVVNKNNPLLKKNHEEEE